MLFIVIIIFAFFILYLYIIDKIIRKKELQCLLDSHKIIKENKRINKIPDISYLVRIIDNNNVSDNSTYNYKTFFIWKNENFLFLHQIKTNTIEKIPDRICINVKDILFFEISKERLTNDELIDFVKNSHNNIYKRPIARTIQSIIKNKEKETYITENRKIYVYYLDNSIPKSISLISKNYNTLKNLIPEKELDFIENNSISWQNKESILELIDHMYELKEKGILTEDEFKKHKENLLNKI